MTEKKELQKKQGTISERFTAKVVAEFKGSIGDLELSPYKRKLAQHLFIKIDAQLKFLEAKRGDNKGKQPIVWDNVNMEKLAIDAVHRVELGLDALIPNHISPIPYWNGKLKKYDLDLRVGYAGKDLYRRKMAVREPLDIIYELVYSTDEFMPLKRTSGNPVESYTFKITNPFSRGDVIGGFAYLKYEDSKSNQLVIVTKADFDKSMNAAQSKDFWSKHPEKMQFKTLIHRATDALSIDPEKVNASYLVVEQDDATDAMIVETEITEKANTGKVLEMTEAEGFGVDEGITKHPAYDLCIEQRGCEKFEKVSECPNAANMRMCEKCVHGMELEKEKATDDPGPAHCPNNDDKVTPWPECAGCDDLAGCPVR
jgi:recombination protein RecT